MARWTSHEEATLRRLYPTATREKIAAELRKTPAQVRSKCSRLGLHSKRNDWTDLEIEQVKSAYAEPTLERQTAKLIDSGLAFGRSRTAIHVMAHRLGLASSSTPKTGRKASHRKTRDAEHLSSVRSENAKRYIKRNGHPRGAAGMKHTESVRVASSKRARGMWADPSSKWNSPESRQGRSDRILQRIAEGSMRSGHTRCHGGRRKDLGNQYFRSSWEANYARFLNTLIARGDVVSWEYEPKTFVFESIKRGTRAYTPDFKIALPGGTHEWHEVKGWMDQPSRTRLSRMAKFFPDEKVIVIGESWFRAATRSGLAAVIPNWEGGRTPRNIGTHESKGAAE
jgi:hypothetical protein